LGSQGPPALSQKVPLVMRAKERQAVTPGVVAHSEVPANQRVDGQCSSMQCSEYEPSII
jgi:hypothetical protein